MYYKITPLEASVLGRIAYAEGCAFDPYVGEQEDGSFLLSKEMYELLKATSSFKKIDFSKKDLVTEDNLILKSYER